MTPAPAPSPAEERVEKVARAMWDALADDEGSWESASELLRHEYRRLARAAVAALTPSPAEEAVRRVEALAADDEQVARMAREYEADKARRHERDYWHTLAGVREQSASRLRAALTPQADR